MQSVFLQDLPRAGLAIKETSPFIHSSRISLLRLSPGGRRACCELGWEAVESEWERLLCLHAGQQYPCHTAGLLAFCFQARRRDWRVWLLPAVNAPLEPDAVVTRESQVLCVEFEARPHGRLDKWRRAAGFQGLVALCSFTPAARRGLVDECRRIRLPGVATDLQTLCQAAGEHNPGPLWVQAWDG